MKNIKVVIGANYGDEGKGLLTDFFSATLKDAIVVRFNGGGQAGHTVETEDGKRHVFGNICSGSFVGLPSYFSSFYIVNPITFNKELKEFNKFNISSKIYIDYNCLVTTPFDMLINQIAETVRGNSKHGSCGLGFNETITRSLYENRFKITITDLLDKNILRKKLEDIKALYNLKRLDQLGITNIPQKFAELLRNENIIDNYISDIEDMLKIVIITGIKVLSTYNSIIFEGAQGLLLDQGHKYFPHVTRSNTGIKNVSQIITQLGYTHEEIEIVYVTRAYLTRHGEGPLPSGLKEKPYSKIEDLTNIPNPYQGTLRFGFLDLNELSESISNDIKNAEGLNYKIKLAITCLDQLNEKIDYTLNSKVIKSSVSEFIQNVLCTVNVKEGYLSYGPTRKTIQKISSTSK